MDSIENLEISRIKQSFSRLQEVGKNDSLSLSLFLFVCVCVCYMGRDTSATVQETPLSCNSV